MVPNYICSCSAIWADPGDVWYDWGSAFSKGWQAPRAWVFTYQEARGSSWESCVSYQWFHKSLDNPWQKSSVLTCTRSSCRPWSGNKCIAKLGCWQSIKEWIHQRTLHLWKEGVLRSSLEAQVEDYGSLQQASQAYISTCYLNLFRDEYDHIKLPNDIN